MSCFVIVAQNTKDEDPRDVSNNGFNRFDPKYVSIGPKGLRNNLTVAVANNKCATLRHGGRYGGSLSGGIRGASPSPQIKNIPQPVIQPHQHLQLQQHHLQQQQKVYNQQQQLELQTYQLQQSFNQPPPPPPIQPQQSYSISTVTKEYNKNQNQQQQQQKYPSSTLPYKKPGTGFTETSSILKKHREEINDLKPQNTVYRGIAETTQQQQQQRQYQQYSDTPRPIKQISILNQPLPEIPQQNDIKSTDKSLSSSNQQVLCASNLNNYRSLQRPTLSKLSTSQKSKDSSHKSTSVKVAPPSLPPKNRQKDDKNYRPPQPLPPPLQKSYNNSYNTQQQHSQNQHSNPPISKSNYDRDRDRERERPTKDRDRSSGRSHDDYNSQQFKSSSKLKNMQTLPTNHHHHYPSSFIKNSNMDTSVGISAHNMSGGSSKSNRKSQIESQHSDRRNQSYSSKSQHRNSSGSGSKDYSNHHRSHTDYSATEL